MNKKHRVKKGVTLLEVLISLAIFAIVATPIATMVIKTVSINKASENKQKAMIAAQKVMEEIKAVKDEDVSNLSSYSSKLNLNITKDDGKEDSFTLEGMKDGYLIEGQVNPVEEYSFNKKNPSESLNFSVEIEVEGRGTSDFLKVKCEDNYFTETISSKAISIENQENDIIINGRKLNKTQDFNSNIKISLDKNVEDNFIIKGKNELEKELNIFCYKDLESKSNINVENDGGRIKAYKNLYTSNDSYTNTSRIYKILIKATDKKGETYEVSNYKSVKP